MNAFLRMALHSLMFRPPERPPPELLDFRSNGKNAHLVSPANSTIHVQLACPPDRDTELCTYRATETLVIFMHGNADDVASCRSYSRYLADHLECNVLTFDYPGYGLSSGEGNTTQEGMVDAAEAVFEYATRRLGHDPSSIVLVGKSIGSYPAVHLAAQDRCARLKGLVLVSGVASAARCYVIGHRLPRFVMAGLDRIALANVPRIASVECPVFCIHGRQDTVVPFGNAEDLVAGVRARSQYPPLWVDAGHNDIEARHPELFCAGVRDFVRHAASKSASPYSP